MALVDGGTDVTTLANLLKPPAAEDTFAQQETVFIAIVHAYLGNGYSLMDEAVGGSLHLRRQLHDLKG